MTDRIGKTAIFRMNGVGNAFLREMGCHACPQCSAEKTRASTSGSLIIKNGRQVEKHLLFDFGPGVVDSLIDFNIGWADILFNSHNHFDHIADLDRLLNSLMRTQRDKFESAPTVLHSTVETWKKGIAWSYPWLAGMVNWQSINQEVATGKPIDPDKINLGINLKVTPIPVYHGPNAHEPVIFVVEFGNGKSYKKLVLCWDLLHLVTKHPTQSGVDPTPPDSYVPKSKPTGPGSWGYPTDDYPEKPEDRDKLYSSLGNPAQNIGDDELLPEHQILKEPHELFLAGNTVTPQPQTGHASIKAGMGLIRRINPRRTWIVHYSGHEDPFGPFSDDQLQDWIDKNKAGYGLGDHEILVAQHGMVLAYDI